MYNYTFMVTEHFHAGLRVWIISRLEAQFCNSYKRMKSDT